jgi:N6-L-threonylcarbamoyladenine synthase
VFQVLINKSMLACRDKSIKHLVIGGGVAANGALRERFQLSGSKEGIKVYFPSKALSIDNAAMVAGLGYQLFKKGYRADLNLSANLARPYKSKHLKKGEK